MRTAREKKKAKSRPAPLAQPREKMPTVTFLRVFVLGSVSIVAAIYAIYRHYWIPRPSMIAPVPAATELPVPEIVNDL